MAHKALRFLFVVLISMIFGGVSNHALSFNESMFILNNLTEFETTQEKQQPANNNITLRVALFPYIPDSNGDNYQGLITFIKHNFARFYPQYNLELRTISQRDNFYNLSLLTEWLTNPTSGYDIVEIDTVLLGDLVNAALVAPQSIASTVSSDWSSATRSAVEFNNAYYGYPHLQCAFFLLTYQPGVAQSKTIDQLVQNLGGTPTTSFRIAGNLDSSWDLPALWLNSYHDSYTTANDSVAQALHNYNLFQFDSLRKLARLCDVSGRSNPCLDGTFDDPDKMADFFISGQAPALFGYSERLFRIIKNSFAGARNYIKATPLPLGTFRNDPMYFTDAFVFRRNMSNDVLNAAQAFVEFLGSPTLQAIYVGSGDSSDPNRIPRYLLPVSKSAYDQPILQYEPIYQQFFRQLYGPSFPNAGFYHIHDELEQAILKYIKQ